MVLQIAVWEDGGDLAARIAALARGAGVVRAVRSPGQLAGQGFDLLVVTPGASGWSGAGELWCRAALAPEGRGALARALRARWLVSYGMGRADTLTVSSIRQGRASVCVQREFTALSGAAVERQELVLPYDGAPPERYLALVGTSLMLFGAVAPGGETW